MAHYEQTPASSEAIQTPERTENPAGSSWLSRRRKAVTAMLAGVLAAAGTGCQEERRVYHTPGIVYQVDPEAEVRQKQKAELDREACMLACKEKCLAEEEKKAKQPWTRPYPIVEKPPVRVEVEVVSALPYRYQLSMPSQRVGIEIPEHLRFKKPYPEKVWIHYTAERSTQKFPGQTPLTIPGDDRPTYTPAGADAVLQEVGVRHFFDERTRKITHLEFLRPGSYKVLEDVGTWRTVEVPR